MQTRTLSTALAEIDGHLADLDRDLSNMPAFKAGTPWHTDRTRARDGLLERRRLLSDLAGANAAE